MKTRILIVDDEQDFVQALAERLAIRDFQVATAFSGEEAVKKVKAYNYDVVILDVLMPGMDGLSTMREIKRISNSLPVIMVTKSEEEGIMEGAIAGQIADYLIKPVDPERLAITLERLENEPELAKLSNISMGVSAS